MEQALRNRLIYGSIMLIGLLLLLWLDHLAQQWTVSATHPWGIRGIGLLIILLIALPLGTRELATLFAAEKVQPYRFIASVGSGLLVLHAFSLQFAFMQPPRGFPTSSLAFIIVFVMLFAALRRAWMKQTQEAIVHMAGTVLATLYLGGLGWFLMALRVKEGQNVIGTTAIILMILLVVKSTDIGAYFGGRLLGRHKLIPWLSPGKTWEGLICGLVLAGVVGTVFAVFMGPVDPDLPATGLVWWKGLLFGIVIGGVGQLGDLLESLMKRDAEVKDSGHLVPGFGGVLDIIDSPLLAAPFAYLLFSLF